MYGFHLFARDEDFDLLTGTLPGTLHFLLGDQLERARAVLSGRDTDEVAYAIDCLDWMLRKGSQPLFEESIEALKQQDHHFISRVKALRAYRAHFDITNQSNLPNAIWADYFAALTLAYVTEALYADQHPNESHDPQTTLDWVSALEAMDAVCFAEHLLADSKQQIPPPSDATERGRQGGKVSASKYSDLKDKVYTLYESKYSTGPSDREAARRILQELTEDDLSVLTADDKQIRIQKWIGTYKKEKDRKLQPKFV
jgi:hypothetical protein